MCTKSCSRQRERGTSSRTARLARKFTQVSILTNQVHRMCNTWSCSHMSLWSAVHNEGLLPGAWLPVLSPRMWRQESHQSMSSGLENIQQLFNPSLHPRPPLCTCLDGFGDDVAPSEGLDVAGLALTFWRAACLVSAQAFADLYEGHVNGR